jgi:hypothetical protein
MPEDPTPERLEMLLVVRWLDQGAPEDGEVALDVADAAEELALAEGRRGMLALMAALGALEERGTVRVEWPGAAGGIAHVTVAEHVRRDAAGLFGRPDRPV